MLLAGADTVQIVSVLYDEGLNFIVEANNKLEQWMKEKKFSSINDFRGKMAVKKNKDVSAFYRVQFMKYYSGIE